MRTLEFAAKLSRLIGQTSGPLMVEIKDGELVQSNHGVLVDRDADLMWEIRRVWDAIPQNPEPRKISYADLIGLYGPLEDYMCIALQAATFRICPDHSPLFDRGIIGEIIDSGLDDEIEIKDDYISKGHDVIHNLIFVRINYEEDFNRLFSGGIPVMIKYETDVLDLDIRPLVDLKTDAPEDERLVQYLASQDNLSEVHLAVYVDQENNVLLNGVYVSSLKAVEDSHNIAIQVEELIPQIIDLDLVECPAEVGEINHDIPLIVAQIPNGTYIPLNQEKQFAYRKAAQDLDVKCYVVERAIPVHVSRIWWDRPDDNLWPALVIPEINPLNGHQDLRLVSGLTSVLDIKHGGLIDVFFAEKDTVPAA